MTSKALTPRGPSPVALTTIEEYQRFAKVAKAAGLTERNNNYKTWAKNMLFARALTNGQRMYAPDIYRGEVMVGEQPAPVAAQAEVVDEDGVVQE